MKMNRRYLLIGVSCLLLSACGPSDEELSALGRAGQVQANAPIEASSTITINAPPSRVWNVLTNVAQWPRWQHDVNVTSLDVPLKDGASFTWEAGGTKIRSEVVLLSKNEAVAWIGRASIAKAIHVLTLTAIDSNRTRIESKESMDGPMLSWFYSSSELQASEDRLLQNLKAASEAPQSETGSAK